VKIALTAYTASFPRAHYSDKLGIVVKESHVRRCFEIKKSLTRRERPFPDLHVCIKKAGVIKESPLTAQDNLALVLRAWLFSCPHAPRL